MSCESCEIKSLIYQYAHHIDNGDLESVAAMFAEGKLVALNPEGGDVDIVGASAVQTLYKSYVRLYADSGTPQTLHMTGNVMVTVGEDANLASAKSYAVVFQAVADFPLQPIIGVRYYDQFSRSEGAWHFVERRIDMHLIGDLSRHSLREM